MYQLSIAAPFTYDLVVSCLQMRILCQIAPKFVVANHDICLAIDTGVAGAYAIHTNDCCVITYLVALAIRLTRKQFANRIVTSPLQI